MNVINIESISKIYGEKIIFKDASFGIHEGDKMQDRLSGRIICRSPICPRLRNFRQMQRSVPI